LTFRMARSLLNRRLEFSAREAAVYSVTSDVAASASYSSAPTKPVGRDPAQASDSFAALVDSNIQPDPPSTPSPAPEPQPSQRPPGTARRTDRPATPGPPTTRRRRGTILPPEAAGPTTATRRVPTARPMPPAQAAANQPPRKTATANQPTRRRATSHHPTMHPQPTRAPRHSKTQRR